MGVSNFAFQRARFKVGASKSAFEFGRFRCLPFKVGASSWAFQNMHFKMCHSDSAFQSWRFKVSVSMVTNQRGHFSVAVWMWAFQSGRFKVGLAKPGDQGAQRGNQPAGAEQQHRKKSQIECYEHGQGRADTRRPDAAIEYIQREQKDRSQGENEDHRQYRANRGGGSGAGNRHAVAGQVPDLGKATTRGHGRDVGEK